MLKKNISDGVGSRNESIDTSLDPPLFWLDNIFKAAYFCNIHVEYIPILYIQQGSDAKSYIQYEEGVPKFVQYMRKYTNI